MPLPRLIPLRDFFRNPEKTDFRISPDGLSLAWLQSWRHRLNVHVQRLSSTEAVRVTSATERDIRTYFWVSSTRLAYLRDRDGDENFHLHGVDADGAHGQELTPFPRTRVQIVDDLSGLEDNRGEIIIEMNRRDPKVFDAFRIDTRTGELRLLAENPGDIISWLADHEGRLRIAVTSGLTQRLLHRAGEGEPFQTLLSHGFRDAVTPLLFAFDNRTFYAASNRGRDKLALVRIDPAAGGGEEVVFEHPRADIQKLVVSRRRRVVTGVTCETTRAEVHFFNPDDPTAQLQAGLERRLPGSEAWVVSLSRDENKGVVRSHNDRSQGAHYFFDLGSNEFRKLADVAPWLRESEAAAMQPIAFTARDGLELTGYLTLPPGLAAPQNLPVVLHPHGGPWVRDSWGFDPEVQFLANRGYGVLQINFRSSVGFGRKFWAAGFKQWGRQMQDDLTDGVKWLVAQGTADPRRIGIYGGSYGGYAALAGLAFTPDLYAAGVDYDGPCNLFTLLGSVPPYWEPFRPMMREMVGDPEKDQELLRAVSPLYSADRIRAPLLIIQGANDPRVRKAEADQMVEALRKRGVEVDYMLKGDEGHGFSNEKNRLGVYRAIEAFFARHLGGRSAQGSPLTGVCAWLAGKFCR